MGLGFKHKEAESANGSVRRPKLKPQATQKAQRRSKSVGRSRDKDKFSLLRILKSLGVVAMGGGLGVAGYFGYTGFALSRESAHATQDGLFVSAQDIRKRLKVPPAENAARDLLAADTLWDKNLPAGTRTTDLDWVRVTTSALNGTVSQEMGPPASQSGGHGLLIPDPTAAKSLRMLQAEGEALAAFRQASSYPHLWFDRDYEDWASLRFPEVAGIQKGIQALELEGAFAWPNGDMATFRRDWLASARLVRLLGEDVGGEANSAYVSSLTNLYRLCTVAVQKNPGEPKVEAVILECLEAAGPPKTAAEMCRFDGMEASAVRTMAQRVKRGDPGVPSRWTDADQDQLSTFSSPVTGTSAEAAVLQNTREQYELMLRYSNNSLQLGRELRKHMQTLSHESWPYRAISEYLRPDTAMAEVAAKLQANYRVLRQALTASQMRVLSGAFPAALPLTGDLALDPFNGKRLRVYAEFGNFRVWSVGPDGLDANGNHPQDPFNRMPNRFASNQAMDDIVMEVYAPMPPPPANAPPIMKPLLGSRLQILKDGVVVVRDWIP